MEDNHHCYVEVGNHCWEDNLVEGDNYYWEGIRYFGYWRNYLDEQQKVYLKDQHEGYSLKQIVEVQGIHHEIDEEGMDYWHYDQGNYYG